jgi:glycosyltransferase involved in cell wall biosynthesis
MKPISVVIITLNEEHNIGRCLESVKEVADEIVVVDSLSSDRTKEICLSYGVRFIEQKFLGYIEQKNFALQKATHEFVLSLDADEALDETLKESIREEKKKDFPAAGYSMNRCTNFCGQWIRHGSWYPDRKLRLVEKKKYQFGGVNPHDRLIAQADVSIKHLRGDLLHYSYYSIEELVAQTNRFTTLQSRAMYEKGKRAKWWNLMINPGFAFFNSYIMKLGFLDGDAGLIIAQNIQYQTFLKYAKLRHLQRGIKS